MPIKKVRTMNDYKFTPLPTPYPMNWSDLMEPVKEAVRDLLIRLEGAEKSREELENSNTNKELGSCFLVYGARGTGKSTVLLSAAKAICKDDKFSFFTNAEEDKDKERAEKAAIELKDIVWLDVLDLENLHEEANLLATLLVRVRNALDSTKCQDADNTLSSIFEEDSDSARQQLSRLIHDATLMWEDVHEQDTRSIANKQVAAADIYAGFRKRFKKAMDSLSCDLGRKKGTHNDGCSIVLPIDNIDRSTYHLEAIVKLAQMVSHHRLWLVMSGDRIEVETFLERAYWKELIHSKVGVDTRGKENAEGEDETLVMARRQASATARKLWPASHRIEVGFVKAEETWVFRPSDKSNEKSISELFAEVDISYFNTRCGVKPIRLIELFDLFDLRFKITPPYFTIDDIKDPSSLFEQLKKIAQIQL